MTSTGAGGAAHRQATGPYRAALDALTDGACVMERVQVKPGELRDYRYLAMNPAMQRMFGIADLSGQTIRANFPDEAEEWYDDYDRVLGTGDPATLLRRSDPQDMVIEMNVTRMGEDGPLLAVMRDVTEREDIRAALRAREERLCFLLRLSDALRPLSDPAEIEGEACRLLAEYLDVDRAYYVEVDEAAGVASVRGDFVRGDAPSLTGQHKVADFGWSVEILRRGECHVVDDMRTSALVPAKDRSASVAMQIIACMGTPLIKDGRLVGALCVTDSRPRQWSGDENSILTDVGERLWSSVLRGRAEMALHGNEERLRKFGDASASILWIRDAETLQWTYLTPAFEEIFGLTREDVLRGDNYRSWLDLILPEDRAHVSAAIRKVRRGEDVRFDYRIRRPSDGAIRWLRDSDFPLKDASGAVRQIGGIGQDLTELRETELRLQTLMSGIPQLVWRATNGGHWTWSSPQWTDFTGLSTEESLGAGWLDAVHPDDRAVALSAWAGATENSTLDMEVRLFSARGNVARWFQTRATPVRDADGTIVEWLGTSTDVHDMRIMQDRQAELVAELQHRTRNLMAVVRSLAGQIVSSSADLAEFQSRFLDRLDALARVQGLLSRLDDHDRVTFDELIGMELSAMATDPDRVTLEGPAGIPLRSSTVQALAMALHELATNAIKHGALGQASGRLAVTWTLFQEWGEPWLKMDWTESGDCAADAPPTPGGGHGRKLIEEALPYQLGARTSFAVLPSGLNCSISFPVSTALMERRPDE